MQHPPTADQARISEIFSSLQGEGTHAGERHLFIRFEECHIRCNYCDEDKAGGPMGLDSVMEQVSALEKSEGPHSFVSLTGGEPLLYAVFLRPLMMRLKAEHFRLYLETGGILWKALEEVIGWCDCVAMDMKPASVTGERNFFEEHRKFLEIARAKETLVKIVLSKQIDIREFDRCLDIVAEVAPHVPVVLQPVSAEIEGHEDPDLMQVLAGLQRAGGRRKLDVRIVPRFHKILKIR
jgi:7-carboxy-7-deazaguanine synthase